MKNTRIALAVFYLLLTISLWTAADLFIAAKQTPDIIQKTLAQNPMELTLKDLGDARLKELLMIEDPAFYRHKGLDFNTPGAGITTITQALVKKLYFKRFKPGFAKLRQSLIARFVLDPQVPKDEQLRLFINIAYLGNPYGRPVNGFASAAREYYKKEFRALTEDEYLSLVALLIAPDTFSPVRNPGGNAERVRRIKMVISGEYKPKSHMDLYYGPLSEKEQSSGLAPASYFPGIYKK